MADSNYNQSSFLGGEWSQYAQGRIDLPSYRTALNVSLNGLPMEEGAWTRRSGSRRLGATAYNASGVVATFWLPGHLPCVCELTFSNALQQSFLRFWTQPFTGVQSDDLFLLCDSFPQIVSISATNPAVVTLATTPPVGMNGQPWTNGDEVIVNVDPSIPLANGPIYANKQFRIVGSGTTWQLFDAITGAPFDGTQAGASFLQYGNSTLGHVVRFKGPWKSLAEVKNLRLVQAGADAGAQNQPAYILSALSPPQALTLISPAPGAYPNMPWFTFGQASFIDGPYLDPLPGKSQTGNSTGNIWNLGVQTDGSLGCLFYITDGSYSFQASDIGRQIRLWWQPQAYSAAMSLFYPAIGSVAESATRCTFNGSYWMLNMDPSFAPGPPGSVQKGLGGTLAQAWILLPSQAAFWIYGTIKKIGQYNTPNDEVQIAFDPIQGALMQTLTNEPGFAFSTVNGNQIDTWQLGAYTNTQSGTLAGGWPTAGCYHDDRLILVGALPNRLDASVPLGLAVTPPYGPGPNGFLTMLATGNGPSGLVAQPTAPPGSSAPYYVGIYSNLSSYATPYFSPTVLQGGDVLDSNAIAAIIAADAENQILWAKPYIDGIILGTIGGEFLVSGGVDGGLKPSNVSIRKVTRYGSKFVEPLQIGMALVFVQALGSRVMEYVIDVFSRRFQGRHLNEYAKHLTTAGVVAIAYQEEKIPVVWAAMADGSLAGCTYRRFVSGFVQADPAFMGWHRHTLGSGRLVSSLTIGASSTGTLDQLVMLTTDGTDA